MEKSFKRLNCSYPYVFCFAVFQYHQPPAFEPFAIQDMPHIHRIVYDMYQEVVAEMNAQQQVLCDKLVNEDARIFYVHADENLRCLVELNWKYSPHV